MVIVKIIKWTLSEMVEGFSWTGFGPMSKSVKKYIWTIAFVVSLVLISYPPLFSLRKWAWTFKIQFLILYLTIYTNYPAGNLGRGHKTMKLRRGGRTARYKVYPNYLNRPKRVGKLHRPKSPTIFSEAFQTECRDPFDFPSGISGYLI